jgi:hypothetical protein
MQHTVCQKGAHHIGYLLRLLVTFIDSVLGIIMLIFYAPFQFSFKRFP